MWAPDGSNASIYVIATDRLEPRDLDRWRLPVSGPTLVAAPWISPRTRELLRDYGAGYLDATGNAELRLSEPALFVRTTGDGPRSQPEAAARPIAERTSGVGAPTDVDRSVAPLHRRRSRSDAQSRRRLRLPRPQVLADERLIERRPRGPVTAVEWEPLLRRLIQTYSLLDANTTSTWIAAAGPDRLVDDLAELRVGRWARDRVVRRLAISPVAAPEIAVVYTEDAERLAKAARLLPAKTGANVVLAEPYDPIVFERGQDADGVRSVSIAQAAIDCLTGPGRMPAEGEALLAWMRRNEPRWRASGLTA